MSNRELGKEMLAAACLILFLIFICAIPVHCQELPNTPSKKLFWTETAAFTTANVLDIWTTTNGVRAGNFQERQWPGGSRYLLGKRPSLGRDIAVMAGMQLVTEFAALRLQRSNKRYMRLIGHGLMIQGTYAHLDGFRNNTIRGWGL